MKAAANQIKSFRANGKPQGGGGIIIFSFLITVLEKVNHK